MARTPRWTVFVMLDGTVILHRDRRLAIGRDIMVPRVKKDGTVEVAFMTSTDSKTKELRTEFVVGSSYREGVHAKYLTYHEIHPPTLEGATIH